MGDIYENIEECKPYKKQNIEFFDDIIDDMLSSKTL